MVTLFRSDIIEMPMKMKVWKEYMNLRKKIVIVQKRTF